MLAVTAGIQIVGFSLTYWLDFFLSKFGSSTIAPVFIGGSFLVLSMIVGLILSLKWCGSWKKKILTILLLPTNFTWILFIIAAIRLVGGILDILENIPSNFG